MHIRVAAAIYGCLIAREERILFFSDEPWAVKTKRKLTPIVERCPEIISETGGKASI